MSSAPVTAGQVLAGKYRIERVLGEGGMGVVVEAHDTSLERRVAIKFLLPDFAKHPEATQRFMREARAAVKIQSEHVARVIDVGALENGAPYMVMEFLEGSDLAHVIEATGALPIEDTALYVIQACEALAEAHAHGIVHRDLKPANLFLANQAGGSRKVKVLDFGISKTLTATDPGLVGSLTRTSSMMGSPLYMSPEQMKSARDVDLRTDIWALGVILYESLAGRTPFTGNNIPEISAKVLLEDPEPICRVNPSVPAELAEVTSRALCKRPEMRFQNVGELAMALLPFAPSRARTSVERIVRVLDAAGMTDAASLARLAPNEPARSPGAPLEVMPARQHPPESRAPFSMSGKRKPGTVANFGHTQGDRAQATGGSRRLMVAAIISVCAIGGGAFVLLAPGAAKRGSSAAAARPAAGGTAQKKGPAPHVAEPVSADVQSAGAVGAAQPEPSEIPVPEAPATEAANEPLEDIAAAPMADAVQAEASPVPPPSSEPASPTVIPTASSPQPAPARTASPRKAPSARSTSSPPKQPASATSKETGNGHFTSKFGGRK